MSDQAARGRNGRRSGAAWRRCSARPAPACRATASAARRSCRSRRSGPRRFSRAAISPRPSSTGWRSRSARRVSSSRCWCGRSPTTAADFELVAGERRWRAAQRVGLHEVPVIMRQLGDSEALEIALVENLQREDLSPLEEAEAYSRLTREFGRSQAGIAEAVGKSRSHVANTLRLLGLPAAVRRSLEEGALTAGHARALLAAPDPAALAAGSGAPRAQCPRHRTAGAPPRGATSARPRRDRDADTLALEARARHRARPARHARRQSGAAAASPCTTRASTSSTGWWRCCAGVRKRAQRRPALASPASANIASRQIVSAGSPVSFMRNSASASASRARRSRAVAPAGELAAKAVLLLEKDRRAGGADRLLDRAAAGHARGQQMQPLEMAQERADHRNRRLALLKDAGERAVERGGIALGGGQQRVVERQRGAVGDRRTRASSRSIRPPSPA